MQIQGDVKKGAKEFRGAQCMQGNSKKRLIITQLEKPIFFDEQFTDYTNSRMIDGDNNCEMTRLHFHTHFI